MFCPVILLALILAYSKGLSYHSLVQEQWEAFKLEHNKLYPSEDEERYRMKVFMENMHTILEHNKLYELGVSTYKMGMNQFGDLTDDEFRRYYLIPYNSTENEDFGDSSKENGVSSSRTYSYLHSDKPLPKELDWRVVGAVSKVKDQGKCGSCYAFSATGALEAQYYFKWKTLVPLSEQNILDCTYKKKKYNNVGCSGGRVDKSFQYIIDNVGIDTEESYPYKAARSKRCLFDRSKVGAQMSTYTDLPSGNETELEKAVAIIGPVSVMVDSNNMRFYSGGIYDDPTCSSTEYTHGMLVIGYGVYKKYEYWLLKNSWGDKWGEMGYMMMMRNKKNQCAIATAALYPLL